MNIKDNLYNQDKIRNSDEIYSENIIFHSQDEEQQQHSRDNLNSLLGINGDLENQLYNQTDNSLYDSMI